MNTKIAFPELVDLVAEATSTTRRVSELFLKELFATISQALIEGQDAKVKNLGTFSAGDKGLVFAPDKSMAGAVNQSFAVFEPVELSDMLTDEQLGRIDAATDVKAVADESDEASVGSDEPAEVETAAETAAEPASAARPVPEAADPVRPGRDTAAEPTPAHVSEPAPTVAQYRQVEFERQKAEATHRAFLKGMLTGVLATLLLGGIFWTASRSAIVRDDSQPAAHSDTAASQVGDTTTVRTAQAEPVVTDTCSATMYLSKISSKHYGKADFWIYIYEENKDKIADPNNVTPGTVVVIPPPEKYGINPNDKSSIDRARRLTFEVLTARR